MTSEKNRSLEHCDEPGDHPTATIEDAVKDMDRAMRATKRGGDTTFRANLALMDALNVEWASEIRGLLLSAFTEVEQAWTALSRAMDLLAKAKQRRDDE